MKFKSSKISILLHRAFYTVLTHFSPSTDWFFDKIKSLSHFFIFILHSLLFHTFTLTLTMLDFLYVKFDIGDTWFQFSSSPPFLFFYFPFLVFNLNGLSSFSSIATISPVLSGRRSVRTVRGWRGPVPVPSSFPLFLRHGV